MNTNGQTAGEKGAITLLVAMGLVLLASLTSILSTRSVLMDQRANDNHAQANQARWAADAALARAHDLLQQNDAQQALLWGGAPCPEGVTGPQWECSLMDLPKHPGLPMTALSATAVRDVVDAPHRLTVHAYAQNAGQHSRAQVRESVFIPTLARPAPNPTTSALVLNGCVSEGSTAALRVCTGDSTGTSCAGPTGQSAVWSHFVSDSNGDGRIDGVEKTACLALKPASLVAGQAMTSPDVPSSRSPCNRAAWRSVLGDITERQLRDWSAAQERMGLNAHTQPPRTVYWVDQAKDWLDSVGNPEHPVLLVFSAQACAQRCPRIGWGTRVIGTVVVDAGCQDEKMQGWSAGRVQGQLVVESGIPGWQSGTVIGMASARQAYSVQWPKGIDPAQTQRIHGTWSEGTP
jgi:hypothetical protein